MTKTRKGVQKVEPNLAGAVKMWPTPNTLDSLPPKSPEALLREATVARPGRKQPANLRDAVSSMHMWPTPTVGHAQRGNHDEPVENYLQRVKDYEEGRAKGKPGKSLGVAVRMWPTPRANPAMAATITPESAWAENRFPNLETVVGRTMWPTPNASDNRDRGNLSDPAIQRRIKLGKQVGLTMAVKENKGGGTLNPTWVEWLMGWPLGWTDLKPSETDKYQQWLRQHGRS
jgi:DNA (cytosine-5)-methyltransferase 1